ncbi:translocation/assembly module TamB domain-containing protein [Mucilaginibacter sp.]|uniref:translocation/assembly module TamB domain-containing protein n=1 Tax=Mucilaginibacter sp. TaxID=1882438 RepID=UPI0028428000|nr:translocation/assembly module TamB domain-containing protein [Mucilaginibacter sp.]MDR3697295.1 translocation/assembly module TamB domain-containing protein [Mucilaginibacter sp.]
MARFGRIALKTILWILGSIVFLILLIIILIQVPSIQNFVKDKAVTFIQGKIHTKVKIGHITLGFPKMLVLEDVYFEDQKKDTLIAGDKLKVDIDTWGLLHRKVEVSEIDLDGITTNINRGADSVFNFQYILTAFAGEQKKPIKPADTTTAMKFSVGKIVLDKINVSYKDVITGNNVKFILGHFDTRIKDFDLDKMKFAIPKITISDVDTRIIQTAVEEPAPTAAAPVDTAIKPINVTLKLGIIDISKIKVDYRGPQMATNVNLGKLLVEMDKIDLKNQNVGIKSIELSNTRAWLSLAKPQNLKAVAIKAVKKLDTLVASPQKSIGWHTTINKVSFSDDNVKFDNEAQKALPKGLDFGHMDILNINSEIENLSYSPDSVSGKVNSFSFREKSGLVINKFHTTFLYGPKSAYLNDLLVETPHTLLQKQLQVSYPSIASLSSDPGKLFVNANLDGSHLGLKDVLLLMPSMATMDPFKNAPNAVFRINGRVIGKVNNLSIPSLEISGLSNTHIKASATITGLPDMNKAYFNVNLADFNTGSTDIAKLVSPGMIPASVNIPSNLNLKGTFKGSMYNFATKLGLRTTYGALDVDATIKNGNNKTTASYSANIKANNLNVGALTKQAQPVGNISLTANVKGTGLDPKKADIQFSGDVVQAYVKGYNYQHLALSGTAHSGSYTVNARMKDPNINFSLDGKADMNKKYPSVNATLMIDSINLQKLKLTTGEMRIHGKLVADVPTANPDYLNASIKITDLLINQPGKAIHLDTISLVSTANADSSTLKLKAPMLYAHMAGKYKLTEVGPALEDVINKYYNTAIAKPVANAKPAYSPQHFNFDVHLVKTPLATEFLPDLKTLDPVLITGQFDSQTGSLVVNGAMPRVVYGTNAINNLKLAINTGNNALNYALTADEIKSGSSIDLLYTSVTGSAQNNKLSMSLQVRDAARKERYRLAGVFSVMPDEYQFSFLQNGLMLDYNNWTVASDNALQFGGKGLLAKDFAISNGGQVLSVNSDSQTMNAPLTVNFKNFKIETLTRAAEQDSLQVGGVLDGNVHLANLQKSMTFTSDLNIRDFNFKENTVGNIALKVNNQTTDAYAADIAISGRGNQVSMKGLYYTNPAGKIDFDLNITSLNMKGIEGFSFGSLRNASGTISGDLKIGGTTSAPEVRGNVNFNKAGFNVAMLNSYFTMPNESLTFNNDGILFNDFTLVDSLGNKAVVAGTLYTKNYSDYSFGLDITANNFRVINSTQENNRLYYGKLYVDSRIKIRGTMVKPVVDASLTVNDKTDMTIVLPEEDPGIEDRKGVVEVINPHETKEDSLILARQLDSLRKTELRGLDVSATIKVNKGANFTMVVDERNGDIVQVKGDAQLNMTIDPSGKTSLTGTYTVEQGSYNLSYATVKRKFLFKKGSSITWDGDPTLANVNLTATYIANVPPIDLVSDQLGSSQNTVQYKQKLPFNVNLSMKNQLLKPSISFDIVLPDSSYSVGPEVISTVNSRLDQVRQDTNEMNKQVLGVLVLGHFIGDNPLQSQGGGTTLSGAIRGSVSSLLSDQLNKLAGNLIGGIQLSFDLTSGADYSTGTEQNRTDLNVGLSKQFLNDRVTVTVGNNFNLEGQNQPGQKTTDIAGNISVNYKLTKDGRYMVRVYRRDEYIVVEGQVVETGVGFTITYDFNSLKELFAKKTRKEKAAEKKYNEDQKKKNEAQKAADQKADSTSATNQPPTKSN